MNALSVQRLPESPVFRHPRLYHHPDSQVPQRKDRGVGDDLLQWKRQSEGSHFPCDAIGVPSDITAGPLDVDKERESLFDHSDCLVLHLAVDGEDRSIKGVIQMCRALCNKLLATQLFRMRRPRFVSGRFFGLLYIQRVAINRIPYFGGEIEEGEDRSLEVWWVLHDDGSILLDI